MTSRGDCHVRGRAGGEDRSGNSGGHGPWGPWPGWENPEELGRRGERPGRLESRGSESSRGREGERDRAPTPGTRVGRAGTPSAELVAGGATTRRGVHGQARVPRGRCARRSGDPERRLRLSDAEVEVGRPVLTAESGFYEEAALVSPGPRLALRFRLRCLGSPGHGRLTAPPSFSISPTRVPRGDSGAAPGPPWRRSSVHVAPRWPSWCSTDRACGRRRRRSRARKTEQDHMHPGPALRSAALSLGPRRVGSFLSPGEGGGRV